MNMLTQRKALTILFLEGLASSAVQMLAIRQTMPYAGSSVLNTSIIIGFFLAALAIGYFLGGQVPTAQYRSKLVRNLMISIALFSIGLSSPFVEYFFLVASGLTSHPLMQLALYCCFIMSPLVVLLAQTVPLLINAMKAERNSEASGNAYSMSTIGNVIGALATSLVIMYYLGTGYAVAINCLVLCFCLILLADAWLLKAAAMCIVVTTGTLNVLANNSLLSSNAYSDIAVRTYEDGNVLIVNNSLASFHNDSGTAWPYIEVIKKRLNIKVPGNVWVLGAGGFTLSVNDTKHNYVYVDIDPALKKISEKHLIKQEINGEFIVSDARLFVKKATSKADYIVIDLYSNAVTIPPHTATVEFHKLVNEKLTNKGEVILNIIASSELDDEFSQRMDSTIRTAYQHCMSHIVQLEQRLANLVYFCKKRKTLEKPQQFSDNNTQINVLSHLSLIDGKG